MIKVQTVVIPQGTTVILVQETVPVKILFEYAENLWIGGSSNMTQIGRRIPIGRLINFSLALTIPANEILYGWQDAKAPSDFCKMLIISETPP